jgi:hypothetical protein
MANARPTWWLAVDGQTYGPYDLRTMQGYIAEGRVTGDSVVCRVGDQNWAPASGDSLLFRGGAQAPPPFPAGAAPASAAPASAAPAGSWGQGAQIRTPGAGDGGAGGYVPPPAASAYGQRTSGGGAPGPKRIVVAVLGAALAALFFAPWIDAMIVQVSGYTLVRSYQALQSGGPMFPGMPGAPPGMRPPVQVDLGWRAYQPYLLYLIPLIGLVTLVAALAGRLWRPAAILCGVVVWGLIALGAAQAGNNLNLDWDMVRQSLQYVAFGAWGTLAVATVLTALGFTRA